jgi:hypothetical protein
VMLLTVFSLLWVAVRHAARHARAAQGDMIRGVLFIVAVYAGYTVLLGAVTVAMPFLFGRGSFASEGPYAILRYHIVAELLAYAILAVLSALALLLLALRAATFIANLATAKAFSYASFLTLGSLRASLYLALCVGMACVVVSGLKLFSLGFFGAELFDPQAMLPYKLLESIWTNTLLTLIVLLPMVLLLLIVDRAIPLTLLDHCGPRLRAAGYTCRIFSIMTVIGTALLGIFYFFFAFESNGQLVKSRAAAILATVTDIAFSLTILLYSGLLMIWLLDKVIPPTVRGMSRDKLRMLLANAVVGGVILAFAAYIVVSLVANTGFRKEQMTWVEYTLLIPAGVLSAVAILVFLLRAGLYLVRLPVR